MLQPSRRGNEAKSIGLAQSKRIVPGAKLRLHAEVPEVEVSQRVRALLDKIENHSAIVGIVGLGYVGLPFAVEKAKVGYHVVGIEQLIERAERVNPRANHTPPHHHPPPPPPPHHAPLTP